MFSLVSRIRHCGCLSSLSWNSHPKVLFILSKAFYGPKHTSLQDVSFSLCFPYHWHQLWSMLHSLALQRGQREGVLPLPACHHPGGTAKCPLCTEALSWAGYTDWARMGRLKPEIPGRPGQQKTNCCCCCWQATSPLSLPWCPYLETVVTNNFLKKNQSYELRSCSL